MSDQTSRLKIVIEDYRNGDPDSLNSLYGIAFPRLRIFARSLLRGERNGHTLQATALINEAFLRLFQRHRPIECEQHFFQLSVRAMRQILIDHARSRKSKTTSYPDFLQQRFHLNQGQLNAENELEFRLLFEKLKRMDTEVAHTVWLRLVEGLTIQEVCHTQKRESWRVRADYDFGVNWMMNHFTSKSDRT